jgi:plasmid stabilization system protein ParE
LALAAAIAGRYFRLHQRAKPRCSAPRRETIDLLIAFPDIGHKGALSGTREMVVPGLPYVVVYRLENWR